MAEGGPVNIQLKERLAEQSEDIKNRGGDSSYKTFRLNVKEVASNDSKCIKKYNLVTVNKSMYCLPEKVVLVIGRTGSGKSTLINIITNFVLGTKFDEDKRFILVRDEKKESQTESQTEGIASYTMMFQKGFRVPYTLTLIDTPGFGDTRGQAKDKKNIENIKEFFSSKGKPYAIDSISAVLFVVQSSNVRLGPEEKYVFQSILDLFGKDIESNIFPVFSFYDGSKPKALQLVRQVGIPCQDYFKTNSSILFEKQDTDDDDEDGSLQKLLWNNLTKDIKKLLAKISHTDDKSLILTNEVLEERELLQCQIEGLKFSIKQSVALLSNLKAEEKALKDFSSEFSKEVEIIKLTEETMENEPGFYTFICKDCKRNCHGFCKVPYKPLGRFCCVIKWGECKVCLCSVSKHSPVKFHYYYSYKGKRTLLRRTRNNLREIDKHVIYTKKAVDETEGLYRKTQNKVYSDIQQISDILKKLNRIALRPDSFSIRGYIDDLIAKEEDEKELGWGDRVLELKVIRKYKDFLDQYEEATFDMHVTSV